MKRNNKKGTDRISEEKTKRKEDRLATARIKMNVIDIDFIISFNLLSR
jgi:hypothetical protein